eukprot:5098631-Amphidinium_carterae.1
MKCPPTKRLQILTKGPIRATTRPNLSRNSWDGRCVQVPVLDGFLLPHEKPPPEPAPKHGVRR